MIIEKNGLIYTVKETATEWVLELSLSGVDVKYKVSRADCPTLEALKEFVADNNAI